MLAKKHEISSIFFSLYETVLPQVTIWLIQWLLLHISRTGSKQSCLSRLFKATVVGFVDVGISPYIMWPELLQLFKLSLLTLLYSGGRGHNGHRREGDDWVQHCAQVSQGPMINLRRGKWVEVKQIVVHLSLINSSMWPDQIWTEFCTWYNNLIDQPKASVWSVRSENDITCVLRVWNFQTSPSSMSEVQMEVEGEGGEGVVVDALPYIDHG